MSSPAQSPLHDARRQLSLLDATCIMVGIVIGAGIFRTPSGVAALSPSATVLLGIWLMGGVASLLGALCYAELATRYPEDGGTFAFLHRAYGPWASLLFAWTDFWIVRPSNLGAVAFILADYAQTANPLGEAGRLIYALSAVMLATAVHLIGLKAGRWSQNILSILKVVGLIQVVFAAFTLSPVVASSSAGTTPGTSYLEWSQAFVLVMFCYGGWSDLSYVAAEVRHPTRNMLWAMVLGVTAITLLYLAVNAGAIYALGIPRLAASEAFAADVINLRLDTLTIPLSGRDLSLPRWGDGLVGLLVVVCCLGALSGMVFTGARVYFALGLRHLTFAWLGGWNLRRSTPPQSLVAQALMSCVLIGLAGQDPHGFERLVIFNSPCYWGFTLLAALAVIVLRVRDRETPLAFRVPFYPVLPLVFASVCGVLIASSVQYVVKNLAIEAIYSAGILLSGGLVAWWVNRRGREA
jgi:amino acid transporter